jgi:hypothetical protein
VTGVAPHAKERFQVSKRDLGTGEGLPGKGGIIKGTCQGVCAMCSDIVDLLLCYCVYVANKIIVFRL